MIKITCNKCGRESDNQYEFKQKSFSFIGEKGYYRSIHLCERCQDALNAAINEKIAEFLKEQEVKDWSERPGILI